MKKIHVFALASIAAVSVAASCAKLEDNNTPEIPGEGELITITASIPDGGITKVSFDQQADAGAIKLYWEAGDQITVTDASNPTNIQTFTLSSAPGGKTGTFSGTALTGSPSSFNISFDATGGVVYANQTQAADESTAHLRYAATLSGVNKYNDFTFSQAWATANGGGTFASSSVLRLRAKLPDALVGNVQAVIFKASQAIFNGVSEIKVNLTNKADTGESGILTVYASLPAGDVAIPAGTKLCVQYQVSSSNAYTAFRQFTAAETLQGGKVNALNFDCSDISQLISGVGTSASPYLIGNANQMDAMHCLTEAGKIIYFKQTANVNLTGVNWTPLNPSSPYNKGINFDGQNFTISNLTPNNGSGYPSFAGIVYGEVKNVVFDGAQVLSIGNNTAGVLAGYIGTGDYAGIISGITVQNSQVTGGAKNRLGAIAGYVNKTSASITECHAINVTVQSTADRVGGLFGELGENSEISACSASNVTVEGNVFVGGLIGVAYGNVANCTSSGTISSNNTTADTDICLGGLVGYFEKGTISKCSSSVSNQTNNGRDIGGLVGKMLAGTIEKSYSTGDVTGLRRNVGGLIGLITNKTGSSVVTDCYATGNVTGNSYAGGLVGLYEKGTATINNCYATGSVTGTGGFALGGLVGVVSAASLTMQNSAAWNSAITPATYGATNWSSGAIVGVTFPTCTMTDNYRNPGMALTAYWIPGADYDQPNVSSAHPLTDSTGTEMADATTTSGQPHYPQYPYHGKHFTGTLSALASGTLAWPSSVWDFSASTPTLK